MPGKSRNFKRPAGKQTNYQPSRTSHTHIHCQRSLKILSPFPPEFPQRCFLVPLLFLVQVVPAWKGMYVPFQVPTVADCPRHGLMSFPGGFRQLLSLPGWPLAVEALVGLSGRPRGCWAPFSLEPSDLQGGDLTVGGGLGPPPQPLLHHRCASSSPAPVPRGIPKEHLRCHRGSSATRPGSRSTVARCTTSVGRRWRR